jgi:D-3-phosphoglycerate dehydrogenase
MLGPAVPFIPLDRTGPEKVLANAWADSMTASPLTSRNMPRILIGPHMLKELDGPYQRTLKAAGYDLVFAPRHGQMTEAELLDRLAGCTGSVAGSEHYSPKILDAHPQLRIIARVGVGYDSVDVAAATQRGIPVTISPGNAEAVAEHAFGLMLALVKTIVPQHNEIAAGDWPRKTVGPLRGRTLGIVGLGRIGKQVALRAKAFNMPIIASDPVRDEAFATKHGIKWTTTEEVFATADIVSLHLPLHEPTRKSINSRLLRLMKPTAYLVNTARGGVMDEMALVDTLRNNRIAGAGLDVLEREPPAADHPLRTLPNVVLTAHTAGIDSQALDDMADLAAHTVVRYLAGEWPGEYVVNPEVKR